MEFPLDTHTAFVALAGSWAYGTNTPESDVDIRGFCVPPERYRLGFLHTFEQCDSPQEMEVFRPSLPDRVSDISGPIDGVIYDVRKFIKLAAEANPSILETLFVDEVDVIRSSWAGRAIRQSRHSFLSKRVVHTFRGYAVGQIHRIERHRRYLLKPVERKPLRSDFGLSDHRREIPADQLGVAQAAVKSLIDSWEIDFGEAPRATVLAIQEKMAKVMTDWKVDKTAVAGQLLGYDTNFLQLLAKESAYKGAHNDWVAYQEWKSGRNEKRRALEAQFGYDTKHAMQLVRLLQACREILETGDYRVRRPNYAELLAIRNGAWSYDRLLEFANHEEQDLLNVAERSPLPKRPDLTSLDALCVEVTR